LPAFCKGSRPISAQCNFSAKALEIVYILALASGLCRGNEFSSLKKPQAYARRFFIGP
jgi:hypothetical protein